MAEIFHPEILDMHVLEAKFVYFDSKFSEVCS